VCHMVRYKYMTPLKNDGHHFSPKRSMIYREFYDGIVLNYLALSVPDGY